MASVYEFLLKDGGDSSVGLDGWKERVTIIFHGNETIDPATGEEMEKSLCELLANFMDAGCMTLSQYYEMCRKDVIADALMYEDWKEDWKSDHIEWYCDSCDWVGDYKDVAFPNAPLWGGHPQCPRCNADDSVHSRESNYYIKKR